MDCNADEDKPFNPFYIGPHPSEACAVPEAPPSQCSPDCTESPNVDTGTPSKGANGGSKGVSKDASQGGSQSGSQGPDASQKNGGPENAVQDNNANAAAVCNPYPCYAPK